MIREVVETYSPGTYPAGSWPRPVSEICSLAPAPDASLPGKAVAAALILHDLCLEKGPAYPISLKVEAGSYGPGKPAPLGIPFETFSSGWGSIRPDPELARAWTEIPAAVNLELRHGFSPRAFVYFRVGLRRDFSAWRQDDLALNLPLSTKEVDLNEPSLGYFNWEGDYLGFTVGRFPVHWSPSPDFGLALSSSVPYHNAVQAALKMPRARYLFLVSSLNPWLEGTPPGGSSSEDYPVGSEEWRQRHYPDSHGSANAHRRVYDARAKTLFAHRLETWFGPLTLGLTETNIVGGKVPDLRDGNPFGVFHNDFREGYSNNNVSLDAHIRLPWGLSLAWEVFMDDLEYSETEGESATPSLLGYLGSVRHAVPLRGWILTQSVHAVYTDPFLYSFLQPLNTYSSRHILTSNFQQEDDPVFVDKYVVDYPLGYLRGGDAMDFWYRLEAWKGARLRLAAELGFLAKGEVDAATPFDSYYQPHGSSPSGRPERELRTGASVRWQWRRGTAFSGGAGFSRVENEGNSGRDRLRPFLSLGASWSTPP